MKKTELKTQYGRCSVYVPGSIKTLGEVLDPSSSVLLVDTNVLKNYSKYLHGFKIIDIGQGETTKTLSNAGNLIGKMLEKEVDRTSFLVGIGGGVATDLAGFVASIYQRGIRYGFVSTTLLGQVDAAIGGKNGVNYRGLKNMIGTIRQPEFVYCDILSLKSLEKEEFRGGFAEIIKYAAIRRAELVAYLEENIEKALSFDQKILEYLIYESVRTKISVVESDEMERGERKFLNFGHTFGHAIEKIYNLHHGEAVAIGMVLASRLSANLGRLNPAEADRLTALIKKAELPVEYKVDPHEMSEVMKMDKKRSGSHVSFILLDKLGQAILHDIPVDEIKSVLHDLC